MKSEKDQANIFRDTIEKLGGHACAVCGATSDAVASFTSDNVQAFDMSSLDAIYFPVCLACLKAGIDWEFLEMTLAKCGTKLMVE